MHDDSDRLRRAGITDIWPCADEASATDLVTRVEAAQRDITMIGLTRNFYARDHVLPLFEARAAEIPVTIYSMDPRCASRADRYRLEPTEAALADPERYVREVLRPLHQAARRVGDNAVPGAGLQMYLYNFPAGIALEQIDDQIRVMMYGFGKRGTDSPILVFDRGTPHHTYFEDQVRWFHQLATDPREPWVSKGLVVRPVTADDLA